MKNAATKMRTLTALVCLAGYTWMKYAAGGVAFSLAYAQQVLIIVLLTALLPYGLTRLLEHFAGRGRAVVRVFAPSLLACAGYWIFFVVAIAPYAPEASALPVVLRGLIPGVVITMLLWIPSFVTYATRRAPAPAG